MIIYKIQNKINGKVYIGQTTGNLNHRMSQHKSNSDNYPISNAIRKYGIENFDVTELVKADTLEELNRLEIHFIEKYDSIRPNGYNIKDGGKNAPMTEKLKLILKNVHTGRKHTEESKQKMSEWHKGKKLSEKTKQKIGAAHKGKLVSSETKQKMSLAQVGKEHTEETKLKISIANKGKKRSSETKQKMSEMHRGENNINAVIDYATALAAKIAIKAGEPTGSIAKTLNVSRSLVYDIKREKTWRHIKI